MSAMRIWYAHLRTLCAGAEISAVPPETAYGICTIMDNGIDFMGGVLLTLTKTRRKEEKRAIPAQPDFYHLFWAFFLASFFGVVIETVFMLLTRGALMNRSSVLYGPFSLVWGFGAVLFTLLLDRLQGFGAPALFLGGMLSGSVFEYFCSWLQETLFGLRFWSYYHLPFNLNGRICLIFSVFWGAAALLWMKALWPALCAWLDRPRRPGRKITRVLVVFMALNIAITAAALLRMDARFHGNTPSNVVEAFLDQNCPDDWLLDYFTNVKYIG